MNGRRGTHRSQQAAKQGCAGEGGCMTQEQTATAALLESRELVVESMSRGRSRAELDRRVLD